MQFLCLNASMYHTYQTADQNFWCILKLVYEDL
jgi:hypothetical protein